MNDRLLEELRPVGFAVAYRRLDSVSEAEAIVQRRSSLSTARSLGLDRTRYEDRAKPTTGGRLTTRAAP